MRTVFCDNSDCWHCIDGECSIDYLSIEDGECADFEETTERPEYKSVYWAAIKGDKGEVRRRKMHGLRYERDGMVFYTRDNIRNLFGIPDRLSRATFTEERTGCAIPGEAFVKPDMFGIMKAALSREPDVMSYPEE